uniref:Uncharacterized protein n=1 Tax=Arundo donax TaxID=35708 RepID=A0A0A9HED3_ARUDO
MISGCMSNCLDSQAMVILVPSKGNATFISCSISDKTFICY